ncbi:MAG: DUF2852 domain-containing protein [Pseudomonadota bacterium]
MVSTVEKTDTRSWRDRRCGGHWTGMNIAAMVVGFVFFWPLGLVILYWTLKGRNVKELPGAIKDRVGQLMGGVSRDGGSNVVFNEYQQTQYDRIREIKAEIKERSDRFNEFRADARRRADQEEFDRFMASTPNAR